MIKINFVKVENLQAMNNLLTAQLRAYKQLLWQPLVDIYEDSKGWLVKIELAGVCNEDIDISVTGECLIISGTRRDCAIQKGQKLYSMEIAYNKFQRVINIPCNCNIEKVNMDTEFKDGMLLIRLKMRKGK
ncbi:MAG: Hsp20/alpha crystallin family protein [Thiohalomonadales bacterium]